MNADLVVEVGCEEIPAWMLEVAAGQLAHNLIEGLKSERLSGEVEAVWYTPRRLVAGIRNIPVRQADLLETLTGPPKRVGFDESGAPTQAALAFAKKNGVSPGKIRVVETPKGEYLSIVRRVRGIDTRKILKGLIPAAIAGIQFPKTMCWTPDKFRFARPIRWIGAVFQGRAIRFRLADVTSSAFTSGHRFVGAARARVSSLAALREVLRNNGVVVDPGERKSLILQGLQRQAAAMGGRLREDPELLQIVVNLNESPSVIGGSFDRRYLSLPQEILITVMREHQKYFAVMAEGENLLPGFLAVINLPSDPDGRIRSGHERVLRARLADAEFFWSADTRSPMLGREASLRNLVFQEKLGSYFDKTQRILKLLPQIACAAGHAGPADDLLAAGRLAKCDLVTEMVKEFTDLQGIVGGLYARAEGYPETIWRAVYEQYQPLTTASPSPSTGAGAILSIADRIDTICGCFSIGLVPTGSKDPFALRRQGNGLLKIILDHRLPMSLGSLVRWGLDAGNVWSEEKAGALMQFFEGRLRFLLDEMAIAHDCINAAFAAGFDDPADTLERVRALQAIRHQEDFLALASAFKRINNILAQSAGTGGPPDELLLKEPAEAALYATASGILPQVAEARQSRDYLASLQALASLRPAVDRFFDQVLVMAEDPALRANRFRLLRQLADLFLGIADISQIVIAGRP